MAGVMCRALVIAALFGSVLTVCMAEVRFEACTYSDSMCTEDKECETETTSDCADTDVDGLTGDVGIKVACGADLNGTHTVQYFTDDDCDGEPAAEGSVQNTDCVLANTDIFQSTYITVECFESAICFSRDSLVLLESGTHKHLADVVAGDRVQSVDDAGKSVFSEVFLTQHSSSAPRIPMLQIKLAGTERPLLVTEDHYLRVPAKEESYAKASTVKVGDKLFVIEDSAMELKSVQSVSKTRGVPRNVHTMNDRIVVDGVVASCVSSNQVFGLDTMQIRMLLAPLKALHSLGLRRAVAAIDRAVHLVYTTAGKI